ncbi:MAG: hypothetical protein SV775_09945 [Thermodesulfobacteriota bacterium]|nr:hypothetical protein [Thermodesulfobacteriota bacterium]
MDTDIDGRMENSLAENDESPGVEGDGSDLEDSALRDLKAIILSIDWEITDEIMARFIKEVARLKDAYKDNKIVLTFLQILGSAGKYIKARKAAADPDVIRLLNSAYTGLEKVLLRSGIKETERKEILLVEFGKFKDLKERISDSKTTTDSAKEMMSPGKTGPVIEGQEKGAGLQEENTVGLPQSDMRLMLSEEAFASVIDEIKQVIKAEFDALRAELKLSKTRE